MSVEEKKDIQNQPQLNFINLNKVLGEQEPVINPLRQRKERFVYYITNLIIKNFLLLFIPIAIATVFIFYKHTHPKYRAQSTIFFQKNDAIQADFSGSSRKNNMAAPLDQRNEALAYMNTNDFYIKLAREVSDKPKYAFIPKQLMGTYDRSEKDSNLRFTLEFSKRLQKTVNVKKGGIHNISVIISHYDKEFGMKLADAISKISADIFIKSKLDNIITAEKHVQGQIDDLQREIEDIKSKLLKFKRDNNVLSIKSIESDLKVLVTDLEKRLRLNTIKYGENNRVLGKLKKDVKKSTKKIIYASGEQTVGYIDQEKIQKIRKIEEEQEFLMAKNKALQETLKEEKKRFAYFLEGEETLNVLEKQNRLFFDLLNKMKERLKIMETQKVQFESSIRVTGNALLIEQKNHFPVYAKLFLAYVFIFGTVVFGLYYLNEIFPKLRYNVELDEGVKIVGLPKNFRRYAETCFYKIFNKKKYFQTKYVKTFGKNSIFQMAIENLAKELEGKKVAAILSPQSNDGKSFLTIMLAVYLAKKNKKVLILDFDQKVRTAQKFLINNSESRDTVPLNRIKYLTMDLKHGNLIREEQWLEILNSHKEYDYVLLDTPPLDKYVGVLSLAQLSDVVYFVGAYLHTSEYAFKRWIARLTDVREGNIVAVLNKVFEKDEFSFILENKKDLNNRNLNYILHKEDDEEIAS